MDTTLIFAHSKAAIDGAPLPPEQWEPLFSADCPRMAGEPCAACTAMEAGHGHANKVAVLAGMFAQRMFAENREDAACARHWGELLGWWHDLGKFAPDWQAYLRAKCGVSDTESADRVDHSSAGARHAVQAEALCGQLLAYCIAGHHSGLLDAMAEGDGASQRRRLDAARHWIPFVAADAPAALLEKEIPPLPPFLLALLRSPERRSDAAFSISFFVRMVFSCLVDADFLATEAFMSPQQGDLRNAVPADALAQIERLVSAKIESFPKPAAGDVVNQKRAQVVADCVAAALKPAGIFTLTVPTGGGKTLSSLLFALRHALANGQQRIIYVVPFTSIVEQNADVIRRIVEPLERNGFTPLVEHHSSLSPDKDTPSSRLAAENWDAPIIITTAVQFYESLFAARTSRTRKIHNIANAVVVLDEAQTLPVDFLAPCLRTLQELADHYNTTSVLCTATQPAVMFDKAHFPIGLRGASEIIASPQSLFQALKRVEVSELGEVSDVALVERLRQQPQVLCIVNRRKHARQLFHLLGDDEAHFHLSALMCAEHRSAILDGVRARLDQGLPVRLISTQLIEAGVDIDFPVVYRALAGLDSIAQAAGRCNRNGKLARPGAVYIFRPEDQGGETYFRDTADVSSQLLSLHDDLIGMDAIAHYFDNYYYKKRERWDAKKLLAAQNMRLDGGDRSFPFHFQFRTIADSFRLIDQVNEAVIIPFDARAQLLVADLRNPFKPLGRSLLRALQRYTVQITPADLRANWNAFEHVREDSFHVLISPQLHYSPDTGLMLEDAYASAQTLSF